jgi:3-phytase
MFGILFFACNSKKESNENNIKEQNTEAREDSVKLAEAIRLQSTFKNIVTADYETKAVESEANEDAADDPAIWVNTKNPEKSIVIGTNKKAGLYVYDMKGNQQQFVPSGKVNNVDLREGFRYKGKEVVIVAGSNRSNNSISLFYLDPETGILSDTIKNLKSTVDEVYGICLYKSKVNNFYIFVNGKGGMIEQWAIKSSQSEIYGELIRGFEVNSQPEGMVADDKTGILYLGVEEEGIFKIDINNNTGLDLVKISESDTLNPTICYDVEGLALYHTDSITYLIASIQGNFSYAIFKTGNPDKYITSFVIKDGVFDGVEETDGIEITNFNINTDLPKGLLVVQDGFNYDGDTLKNQNFKYISIQKIESFFHK